MKIQLTKPKAPSVSFSRLSKPQQRVAICKDAIRQITITKTLQAQSGVFFGEPDGVEIGTESTNTLRDIVALATPEEPCYVCALGALMASQATVNGNCSLDDLSGRSGNIMPYDAHSVEDNQFSTFMKQYFSVAQLQLIEIAFELGGGGFSVDTEVESYRDGLRGWEEDWQYARTKEDIKVSIQAADRAMRFGDRYSDDDTKRLLAIMRNIVRNGGTFVP